MESDDLICPVCLHYFNEAELTPRLIPVCGHTICSECIQKVLAQMHTGDLFVCPEDR